MNEPYITNDAVVLGLFVSALGLIFYVTQQNRCLYFSSLYQLFCCYLIPSLLSTFGIVSAEHSSLWPVAKNYFLPAADSNDA